MADPEPRASGAQPRTPRSSSRETGGRGGSERPSPERPGEARAFEAGADVARRATEAGAETARDMTRAGAESGRRLAETGSRALDRGADLWRQSLFPLTTFSYEMNRLLGEFWRTALPGVGAPAMSPFSASGAGMTQGFNFMGLPCADLHETADAYHISVELPGLRPEDVEVIIEGDSLIVRGEKRDVHREEQAGVRVNERRFGRFERRFNLPRDADREDVEADFRNGLLEIRVARRREEEQGRRRVEVRHEEDGRGGGRVVPRR